MTLNLLTASLEQIAAHYQAPQRAWVRANMISSLDGHFVGKTGSSRDLTNPDDLKLLLLLRALSDVVLVGANTARSENYRQPKGRPEFAFLNLPAPRLAIVSASLNFDLEAPLFTGGNSETIILNVGSQSPSADLQATAEVISIDPKQLASNCIDALSEIGLTKVTCEGGPKLLAALLAANSIDEYDLTIAPITVGGGPRAQIFELSDLDWDLVGTGEANDYKYLRYLRR